LALLGAVLLPLAACSGLRPSVPFGPDQVTGALPPDTVESLSAALAEGMDLAGASGAIAGVWVPWAGQWEATPGTVGTGGASGAGRPHGGDSLTADMTFRIGTLTTAMTCTVLLRLVEERRVGLDDPVSEYLTRLPGIEGITLRQLCQNTAGVGRTNLEPQYIDNPTRQWAPLELVSGGLGSTRTAQPGRLWTPSDAGVQMLGMALQAATGQDWASLYRQYVFEPLGLGDTSYPDPQQLGLDGPHPRGWAAALGDDGKPNCALLRDVTSLSNSMAGVAGGVVSTLEDVKTWSRALATGSLLSEATAGEQWKTVPEGKDAPDWRGYGLGAEQLGPVRGGAGSIPGFISATLADPVSGLTVVVLVNNSSSGAEFALALARRLIAIAATAPGVHGREPAKIELPWTADDAAREMRSTAACPAGAAQMAQAPAG